MLRQRDTMAGSRDHLGIPLRENARSRAQSKDNNGPPSSPIVCQDSGGPI